MIATAAIADELELVGLRREVAELYAAVRQASSPQDGPVADSRRVMVQTAPGESTRMRRLGDIALPAPINATIAVWWLEQYGGGLFIPIRDGTAGTTSYGGGRYLIDTTKGADLGDRDGQLTVDLNFLFNPSCRYDAQWQCPLAPADNVIDSAIHAGEQI